jgi:hypothetical protein
LMLRLPSRGEPADFLDFRAHAEQGRDGAQWIRCERTLCGGRAGH